MKRAFFILLLSACCAGTAAGQTRGRQPGANADSTAQAGTRQGNAPVVTARFIPDSIAIGDHFRLRIEVTKDVMQQIAFPTGAPLKEGGPVCIFYDKLEVLSEEQPDTVRVEGRRVTLGKNYNLTIFDAGVLNLKDVSVIWLDKNIRDTIRAKPDSLLLKIGTFEIDTLTQTIYDIKPALRVPLKFGEVGGYLLLEALLVALIVLAILLIRKYRRDRSLFGRRAAVPPHVAAIRALEALDSQKLWQNNKHKQYYTLLADIVRTYIEGRYGIAAMEMTSDELVGALREQPVDERSRTQLASMLRIADLAKFAKFAPGADDNEACYNDAYYFVENTKPAEVEASPETPNV